MNTLEQVSMDQNISNDWWVWLIVMIIIIICVAVLENDYESEHKDKLKNRR